MADQRQAVSGDLSFAGSIESDLTRSKVWLCENLPRKKFKHIYVLGSWYGNVGLIMNMLGFDFDCITNVDTDSEFCKKTQKLYKLAKFDKNYRIVNRDCNLLNYQDADLVINTSTNDIKYHDWFANIPPGCIVAVQCRNNQPMASNMDKPTVFDEFMTMFAMDKTICAGTLTLSNHDETYDRYMLIGIK
jgi:hypothetical protein